MVRFRNITAVLVGLSLLLAIPASGRPLTEAHDLARMEVQERKPIEKKRTVTEKKYLKLYWEVVRKYGRETPGRNLVTRGSRSHGRVRSAETAQLKRSIEKFEAWLAPPPPVVAATTTGQAPSSYQGGGYAIPSGIVMCESGGDFTAVNNSNPDRPAGGYQIITDTWLGHGGGKYAPTADLATPQQQGEIAGSIYAGGAGRSQWAC